MSAKKPFETPATVGKKSDKLLPALPVVKSFSTFGIALDRMLYWQKADEMGNEVLVITFDNKEKLILRDAPQIQAAEEFFATSGPTL